MTAWLVGIRPDVADTGDRIAFTVAVLVAWAVAGLLPIHRLGPAAARPATVLRVEPALVLVSPVISFAFLSAAWAWPAGVAAALLIALAAGYAFLAGRLHGAPAAFESLVLAAGGLAAWGVARWFGVTDARSLGVAVALACCVVWVARRERNEELKSVGHVAALGLACALLLEQYLAPGGFFTRVQSLDAARLMREVLGAAIGAAGLAYVGFTSGRGSTARYAYLTAAHLVVSLLARTILLPLPSGAALTSTTWAVYAVALIAAGLRTRDDVLRQIGLGTVLVTVAKVLLVDLASIPTLWRVLLFMGLGTLMLVVSYFVPALVQGRRVNGEEPAPKRSEGVKGVRFW
jgi:hypothetical protein